jgi:hypothetical protein
MPEWLFNTLFIIAILIGIALLGVAVYVALTLTPAITHFLEAHS